jgi:hypothetical protein
MPETDSASIVAASIDLASVAGHNLLALLLRLAANQRSDDISSYDPAFKTALALGLGAWPAPRDDLEIKTQPPFILTPLGREVAELLRPKPWTAGRIGSFVSLDRPDGTAISLAGENGPHKADTLYAEADRIAVLLTQDDLRVAKTYRTEAP